MAGTRSGRLRPLFAEEHEAFRDTVRRFLEEHAVPSLGRWEADRIIES